MKKIIMVILSVIMFSGCEGFSFNFGDPDPVVANFSSISQKVVINRTALVQHVGELFTNLSTPTVTQSNYNTAYAYVDVVSSDELAHYAVLGFSQFGITINNDSMENIVISEHTDGNCTITYTTPEELEAVATFATTEDYASITLRIDNKFVFSSEWVVFGETECAVQSISNNLDGTYFISQLYINGNTAKLSVNENASALPSVLITQLSISSSFATQGDYLFVIGESTFVDNSPS